MFDNVRLVVYQILNHGLMAKLGEILKLQVSKYSKY